MSRKQGFFMMSKFEKKLVVVALVFVAIYLGAAAITIHTRITKEDKIERFESPDLTPAEGQLLIAELFLPVMILFTLTICFIIVRKQRANKLLKMEKEEKAEEKIEKLR
jgi:uncharacterized membrane protein